MKFQFSGHESFICKHFWLKKGYDFISHKGNFNDESAVVELGVGKNMVASISYWLKAFGVPTIIEPLIKFFPSVLTFSPNNPSSPVFNSERAASLVVELPEIKIDLICER